jgi:carbon storage regulator
MLVLTRQEGEKICIGDKIIVEITHNGSDRVRLGIDAPPDRIVLRGELHEQLKAEIVTSMANVPLDFPSPVARCPYPLLQ